MMFSELASRPSAGHGRDLLNDVQHASSAADLVVSSIGVCEVGHGIASLKISTLS
jgi:hypothetical protein